MKMKCKRATMVALSLAMALSATACGGRGGGQIKIDETKSQLNIGVWRGGLKSNWASRWAKDFMELHEETSFEEGKKGVEIHVTESANYIDDICATRLPDYSDDIIFCEQVNYYEFVNLKTGLNITEWVTEPLTEYGEERSIADKMSEWDKDYYGQGMTQEYYGVPWSNSMLAINYDIELFENNNFYFAAEGKGDSKGFVKDINTPKSLGPDGRTGIIDGVDYTTDDGLPATYDDFFKMCDKIVEFGYIPFIWAGGFQLYVTQLVNTLVADVEGYDKMQMNYTFDGTATDLVQSIENGIIKYEEATKINNDNGYMLKKQVGNYYALKFLHRLITTTNSSGDPKYYTYNDCFGTGIGHAAAQTKFLRSTLGSEPIAMFIDGTWWYNEATNAFNAMQSTPGMGQYDRKLGIMAIPKATEDKVGEDATWMSCFITSCIVNAEVEESKKELVRSFFRYIHTDKALTSYIYDAHCMRPYKFELTGYKESDLSAYTLQQYKIYNASKVVQPYSTNDIIVNYLNQVHNNYQTTAGIGYTYVTTAFDDGISAEDYFFGMVDYMDSERWGSFLRGVK